MTKTLQQQEHEQKQQSRLAALSLQKRKLLELMLKRQLQQQETQQHQPFSLITSSDREKMPEQVEDAYPLGVVQLGMMFHMNRIRDNDTPPDYHNVSTFIFGFDLAFEPELLQQAVDILVAHEPMFRTSFDISNFKEPLQLVFKSSKLPVSYIDLRDLSQEEQEQNLKDWIAKENFNVMAMDIAPLVKLTVHQFSDTRIAFSLIEPHSISDGWSTHLNMIDIFNLYMAIRDDSDYELEPIHASYADFIRAEKAAMNSPDTKNYWQQVMQNVVITELPLKAPKSAQTKLGEHRYDEYLPEDILVKLHQMVNTTGVPLKSVLLAAHARFLSLLSGQIKVTTGLNFNGRLETKGGINARGLFLNTLPVTLSLAVNSWVELAKQVYAAEIAVLPHRNYPLGVLQGDYGKRSLFDTAFSFLHFHSISNDAMAQSGKIECEAVIDYSKTNFDFNSVFNLHPTDSTKLENKHDANLDRFSVAQLQSFFEFYLLILQDIADNPEADPNRLDFLTQAKRNKLVYSDNPFNNKLPKLAGIHQLFEQQALATPDLVAIECAQTEQSYSYQQLNANANRLAAVLLAQNIKSGALVGLLMARSVDTLVAILAVLKTSAAFVPLDITQPIERVNTIAEQSQLSLVLGKGHKVLGLDAQWMDIDETPSGDWPDSNPEVAISGDTLCYVLYTSGSTGLPKGVMVPHGGVVNYVCWAKQAYRLDPGDCMPLYTSLAFDLTVTTLFTPLISGARIRVYNAPEASTLLINIVTDNSASLIKMTPAHLALLKTIDTSSWQVNRLIVGGEQLSAGLAREVIAKLPGQAQIFNEYGPTEASVGCMIHTFDPQTDTASAVPIGVAAANVRIYVLDERTHPVLEGVKGELYIAGLGLAQGYLNSPEQTAAVFVDDPFFPGQKMYRSGDLVRRLHDDNIEFIARVDNQTKISGYRIELGEIETLAGRHEMVEQLIMSVRQIGDSQQLVAYVVPTGVDSDETEVDKALRQLLIVEIKSHLKQYLPDYMVPNYFVFQKSFGLTPNGKIDRDALPILEQYEVLTRSYQPPKNAVERALFEIWRKLLGHEKISVLDNFFDIGGTSVLSFQLQVQIQEEAGYDISVTDLFEYPTIRDLAKYINEEQDQLTEEGQGVGIPMEDEPIAVIGMAGRFPDAQDVNEFWHNLKNGHESLTWYSDKELLEAGVPEALINHPDYVKAGFTLDNIRTFDAEFFGFTPRDAQLMDPQQRLLFEVAVETLDDGCYGDAEQSRNVGVFVGVGEGFYFINNLLTDPELLQTLGMEVQFGNGRDFAATRLSHRLNLTGPAMTVATACSTSLVAIHQACSSILRNECTMALAGGSKVGQFGARGHLYQEGGILSRDGHCRPFDADAKGTRSGDGCAMILLKRLSQAIADGDNIHAVVKGSALNNDGISKVGYTAPSVAGQVKVIRQALARAQVPPESIGYVEAHGTGTILGDPIEVKGLKLAYSDPSPANCALGSVKSNIGHLDSAAGVASMIKTILALKHGKIPPSINFDRPNPAIQFDGSGFTVNHQLSDWPATDEVRRAGVSSFGIGGTNAHVIVEQAPDWPEHAVMPAKYELMMVSARSAQALNQMKSDLLEALKQHPDYRMSDVAYSLRVGRTAHPYRDTVAVDSISALNTAWSKPAKKNRKKIVGESAVIFMFPGQGSQYVGAAAQLYNAEPRFAANFDHCATLFEQPMAIDLRLFVGSNAPVSLSVTEQIDNTHIAQALLFCYSYSLGKLLLDMGIIPDGMIGHSIGEYTAATLSGVMSVAQAIEIIALRGKLMNSVAPGHMVSVALTEVQLAPLMAQTGAELAVVNAEGRCVLSVSTDNYEGLCAKLKADDIDNSTLHTSHAYHSSMMSPVVDEFVQAVNLHTFKAPQIPFVSNVTGRYVDDTVCSGEYWGEHLRSTVRFGDGLNTLLTEHAEHSPILWEIGPGTILSMLARKQPGAKGTVILSSIPHVKDGTDAYQYWLKALGEYWQAGGMLDRAGMSENDDKRRLSLPAYPFERKEHWFEAKAGGIVLPSSTDKANKPQECFYHNRWQMMPAAKLPLAEQAPSGYWLVVGDEQPLAAAIIDVLKRKGQSSILVQLGDTYVQHSTDHFTVRAGILEDINALTQTLKSEHRLPSQLVYCAGFVCDAQADGGENRRTFTATLFLRSLMATMEVAQLDVSLVTANECRISGDEVIKPQAATLNGLALVAPQEYPEIRCQRVSLGTTSTMTESAVDSEWLDYAKGIVGEFYLAERPIKVALRGTRRWLAKMVALDATDLHGHLPDDLLQKQLRQGGVYVITGGMGNIGLTLAGAIAEQYQAKIVLLSRSAVTPEAQWASEIAAAAPDDVKALKLKQLQQILSHAGELMIVQVDVADADQLNCCFTEVIKRFGTINGVIHAAGQVQGSMVPMAELAQSHFDGQYSAKVLGLQALDKALDGLPDDVKPDFVVLMSSLATVLGGLGFAAYAGANAYMDSFVAAKHNQGEVHWLSINWDGWNFDSGPHAFTGGQNYSVTPTQGVAAFNFALAHALNINCYEQLVHSTGDLQLRMDKWLNLSRTTADSGESHDRPDISVDYVAPEGHIEQHLVEIWQQLLGINRIGVNDSFFELGGDSLLITRVIANIRHEFKVPEQDLSIHAFFAQPTIAMLASYIATHQTSAEAKIQQLNEAGKDIEEGEF